jgi:hypothetical protein
MESKFITIGQLTVSKQAFYVALFGIILSIVTIIVAPFLFPSTVLMLALIFLAAYNINCTIVGSCHIWAWVLTIFYIIMLGTNIAIILANPSVLKSSTLKSMMKKTKN